VKFLENVFQNATIAITGGTGSFGQPLAMHLLDSPAQEIRIFSRDENKQDSMRRELGDSKFNFYLGDIRDRQSLHGFLKGVDFVFHAAALKQVPSCEFFPMQATYTNIIGSDNVIQASIEAKVKSIVCLSTDKAVYPINAMGMSKAIMEKNAQAAARTNLSGETKIAITRYGNVLLSRGSVIPLFLNQIRENKPITVTNPKMTRFIMSLSDSVELVKFAFLSGESGDLFIKKAPGCTVSTLVEALCELEGVSSAGKIESIGIRHGEKMHETLLSQEEMRKAIDLGDFYQVPLDSRSLDYAKYFDEGAQNLEENEPYTSRTTHQLNVQEVCELLTNLPEYAKYLR
jgi:UDP-glucose 4-epimerase